MRLGSEYYSTNQNTSWGIKPVRSRLESCIVPAVTEQHEREGKHEN